MLGYPRWGLHPFLLGEKSTTVTILLLVGRPSGGVALDLIMLPYLLVVDLSLYLQLWIPLDGGSMIVVVLVLVAGGEPGSSYSAIWLPLKIIFLIGCVCCWEIISAFSHLKVFTLLLVLHWVQNSSDFPPFLELLCLQASVISINKFIVIRIFLPLSITCFFLWILLSFFSLLQIFTSWIIMFFCIVFLVDYCASWDLLRFLDLFFSL